MTLDKFQELDFVSKYAETETGGITVQVLYLETVSLQQEAEETNVCVVELSCCL